MKTCILFGGKRIDDPSAELDGSTFRIMCLVGLEFCALRLGAEVDVFIPQ